jgi:hypothetical protein
MQDLCTHASTARPQRCDEIHEADRILRARSPLGVLCTPVDAGMLGAAEIWRLYRQARGRLEARPPGFDATLVPPAHTRLEQARGEMLDMAKQAAERERWRRAPWQTRITTTLRTVVNVAALEAYASTPDADRIPMNKHGKPYDGTGRQLIERLLARVERPTPDSTFGAVEVRYWCGDQGSAMLDAGLVCASREQAVTPDWYSDPFSLPKRIRGIAFGAFEDIDDSGAHPHARLNMVQPGVAAARQFLACRNEILYGLGAQFFPGQASSEQRARVKALFNALEMDGAYDNWARRWGLAPAIVQTAQLPLSDGSTFVMPEYLKGQQQGTMWLRDKLERQIGMASFVEVWRARHRPHKTHPERGVKSFAFQEPESISRQAKARWCMQNGHAVLSLQHDGVVVAFKSGTDLDAACDQMRTASEEALGYEQPCERKGPELPDGVQRPPAATREEVESAVSRVGEARDGEPEVHDPQGLWSVRGISPSDPEQYTASALAAIRADPVLRLHLRSKVLEEGGSVATQAGVRVSMDARERAVMAERGGDGVSRATRETRQALWCALDLHARHHFTRAAAVDGSMVKRELPGRRFERKVAGSLYE